MFTLTDEQKKKLSDWMDSLQPELAKIMKKKWADSARGYYTYEFTPTGIGTIVQVREFRTQKVIDLTEYDHW